MKITFEIDTTKPLDAQLQEIINLLKININNPKQQKINNDDKKVLCADCKKDFYELYEPEEAKKVISYSNNKLGKPLCYECQKKYWDERRGSG